MNFTTVEEAFIVVKSADIVFIHGVSQAPQILIDAMADRADKLKNVRIAHPDHRESLVKLHLKDGARALEFVIWS